jgi:hypothetical protein
VGYRKRAGSLSDNEVAMIRGRIVVLEKLLGSEPSLQRRELLTAQIARHRAELGWEHSREFIAAGDYASALQQLALANTHRRSIRAMALQTGLRLAPRLAAGLIARQQADGP